MKTQISNLRSGAKNQILNPSVNYNELNQATSHVGHAGSHSEDVSGVWDKVKSENKHKMRVIVKGVEVDLIANWSLSGKSVVYSANIDNATLQQVFGLTPTKDKQPRISAFNANHIEVSNGGNNYINVCPSLVEII